MTSALPAPTGNLFGVALNYRGLLDSRLAEFGEKPYLKPPQRPVLFIKTPNTRNGHGLPVVVPTGERLQPGPALGVVIGRRASRVEPAEALDHIAGYLVVNEFSLPEDSYYRPAVKAKCRDGFCALGTDVVPRESVTDVADLTLRVLVNGEVRQENTTANWVRGLPQLLAEITEFMTLDVGDVLITGTPEGRVDVVPEDQVEVIIDGIGRLANSVIAEVRP